MSPKRIVVVGGGFAGLWSAIGAARKLDELRMGRDKTTVTLVERNPYHSIRVRNYEEELNQTIIPLSEILDPVGIEHIQASVEGLDLERRSVRISDGTATRSLPYDRLVFALGSRLMRPNIPGLARFSFDVDTYVAAEKLNAHISALSRRPATAARNTVLVIGSGFTGLEVATEIPKELKCALGMDSFRIVVADINPVIGPGIGAYARPVIEEALAALGIETKLGANVVEVSERGACLSDGEFIEAETVVWCAGMVATPLTSEFPVEKDRLGRVPVDAFMRVHGFDDVFAAGDCAWFFVEPGHSSVMSCQHGRPMGRFAGHNVVADLFEQPMLALNIGRYVTVLDLGAWGALYTVGWDRRVLSKGLLAKETKTIINRKRIYPPRSRNKAEILAAATPVVQSPPEEVRELKNAMAR